VSTFKIRVARIERMAGGRSGQQVCITFAITRQAVAFQVPICLNVSDYDDTEMVQAARHTLHQIFRELAVQSRHWKLSAKDLRQLSRTNSRVDERSARAK
jgi:hypothetical protein